ncbi:MAG: LamG-like jellyroll fold domain-containing protein [Verrucomicrobiota bacterium]|nr:LamG-like jellyroll fold domain-containing protein [Verrucomicrobiota bacterium]
MGASTKGYDAPNAGSLLVGKHLVAFFPMNGDAHDHGPEGHHGSITNATWDIDRLGQANCALRLGGRTLARLDVPLFPVKSPGLTVAFWLHPFDVGILRTVLSHDWGGDGKFQINLTAGRLIGRFRADGGVYEVTLPGIVPHRWQHVVFTFTPGEKGVVEAHLDARYTVRAPATGRLSSSRHTLTIGGIQPGVPGLVDNLRLYNRPLTTAEVGAVYTAEGGSRDGARPVPWSFHYALTSPMNNNAMYHLRYTNHVQRLVEDRREPPIAYWAPTESGRVGSLYYHFNFGTNRTRRIYLGSYNRSWDYNGTVQAKGRGAVALAGSVDGDTWVPLVDHLRPEPQWGGPVFFHDDLPSGLLGASNFWLRVEMLAINLPPGANYSPARHAESLTGEEGKYPSLELKVQW